MKVGFTGTREGTTERQRLSLLHWVKYCREELGDGGYLDEFHHGCCVGADLDALRVLMFLPRVYGIIGHPPDNPSLVSKPAAIRSNELRTPLPYLTRNRDIVDATDMLLACPKGPEERRSGTWSTVRYARKAGKRVVIFWPDGSVTDEPGRTACGNPAADQPPGGKP